MNAEDTGMLIDAASALAAIVAALLAWHFSVRAESAAASGNRLAAISALEDWRRELRSWAFEVIDWLTRAERSVHDFPTDPIAASRLEARDRLSSLLDCGRQHLPNLYKDKHRQSELEAYRGYRHGVLDPIMAAIRVLDGSVNTTRYSSHANAVYEMRRVFVSRVQLLLRPEERREEILHLVQESGLTKGVDPSLGGLLPSPDTLPSGAESLLEPADGLGNSSSRQSWSPTHPGSRTAT